ncbi:transcriptional regulator [Actinoplanes cyaneus]|uniref:Transcriptional regulator n=1 Tax=Actinoplanes cyaneus TaxID=52696 RepID=A0A919M5Q2_9ACTN|nr:helix-turn-helix domain-containing protein [Actinoplanes cyaneus]MCW2137555.1 transcriptional regulator, HxlR family [Actinoplanes cyaneus]GID63604.1 transcriptional regulator [Actinoplanes cyaneus]
MFETADPETCQRVLKVLTLVGDKWTLLVIGHLEHGPVRFGALQRAVTGISHRMLTVTLRALERDGLVDRTAYPSVPPRVEYQLTDLGRTLLPPVRALGEWAWTHLDEIAENQGRFTAAGATAGLSTDTPRSVHPER